MIKKFDLYVQLHIVHRCSIFGTPYAVCRELIYKAHYTILQWNEAVIIFENYVEFFSKFSIILIIKERVKINNTTAYTSRCSNKEAYYG